jgi:eukaryotic-like serine/threonine-protein kinase
VSFDRTNLRGELLGGKYLLGEVIGAGGMGVVYEATHRELRTPCAVKVVAPARGDPAQSRRLLREARVLAELSGPYAVRVLDAGRLPGDSPYLVMERLSGEPLSELLKRVGKLETAQAVTFAWQICAALGEAHARGIIHRDIKPSNVFVLAPDRIKVLDFGLATRFGSLHEDSFATTSEFAGSPRYMSPEQIRASAEVTPRADLWSLAVLLFEMLTGRLPFEASNTGALLAAIVADPATRLREVAPDAPAELDRLIADCLEKNATDRPSGAALVQARLEAVGAPALGTPFAIEVRGREQLAPESARSTLSGGTAVPRDVLRTKRAVRAVVAVAAVAAVAVLTGALWHPEASPGAARPIPEPRTEPVLYAPGPATPRILGAAVNSAAAEHGPGALIRAPESPSRPKSSTAAPRASARRVLEAIDTRH